MASFGRSSVSAPVTGVGVRIGVTALLGLAGKRQTPQEIELRRQRRRHRQIEMAEGVPGQHAAARRALHEALLHQIGLDHLLDHVALVAERRGHGLDPDRTAAVIAARCSADSAGPCRRARARRLRAATTPRRRRRRRRVARPSTAAKSRTRRNSRIATRGVPRERRAISAAPSGSRSMASTRAPRPTISASSAGS